MRLSAVLLLVVGCDPAASPEAGAVLDRLASRTFKGTRPLVMPSDAEKLASEGDWLEPRFSVERTAKVRLPRRASAPFRVNELEVSLMGASDAPAEVARGLVVYRDALDDAAVVQRPTPHGTEDYIEFLRAPSEPSVRYQITLGDDVAGLRQIENTLELLDSSGAPRLRLAEPLLVGAGAEVHRPRLEVAGCAVDRNPAPPWGRAPTPPGSRRCVVTIEWRGEAIRFPAVLDPTWSTPVNMMRNRTDHTATIMPNGPVLVVGGDDVDGRGVEAYYNNAFSTMLSTTYSRQGHTATMFTSGPFDHFGRVLVVGGNLSVGNSELYDGLSGQWSAAGILSPPRAYHAAGRVGTKLVFAGGRNASGQPLSNVDTYTTTTGAWAGGPPLLDARSSHTASRLPNGQILIVGGLGTTGATLATTQQSSTDSNGNLQWSWAPSIPGARAHHSALTSGDGSILIAGGYASCALRGGCTYQRGTQRFVNGAWVSSGNLANGGRSDAPLVQVDGTRAIYAGGRVVPPFPQAMGPLTAVDMFDGTSWYSTTPMHIGRTGATGTRLSDGRVLVTGGPGATAEVLSFDATGSACTRGADCATGICQDGVCCNDYCNSGCQACSAARGAGADGVCTILSTGATGNPGCGAYLCQGGMTCPSSCGNSGQCSPGNYCSGNACVPKLANGTACTQPDQCLSNSCVDGFCCDGMCTGACTACSVALGSTQNGHCSNVTGAGRPACVPYVCDGSGPNCPSSCGSGMKYCAAINRCIPNAYCCADAECASPPDACHQTAGACVDGACTYSLVDCGVGVCSGGACASGPLTLTVTPVSPTAAWSSRMFYDGTVRYTATLTNVSSSTQSVSPSQFGNIGVAAVKRNGVAVPLGFAQYDYAAPDWFYRSLTTLAPGASVQFAIGGATGTDLTPGQVRLTHEFAADGPGSFSVRFYYHYTGDDQGRTDVAHGIVTAADALVTVQ